MVASANNMGREILTKPAPPAAERISYGSHESQFIDFRYPNLSPPRGIAVMIHGGFWRARFDLLYAGIICHALTEAGLLTANLEYRRVGEQGGGWPGTFDDIQAGTTAARRHLVPRTSGHHGCVVLGHSAGGHLALRLSSVMPDLNGVVALGPVAVLRSAWDRKLSDNAVGAFLGETLDFKSACPSLHASRVPQTLIHGVKDDVVPIEISREYVELRKSNPAPIHLIELADADHFDVVDPSSTSWPAVREQVLRLLP